MNDLISVFQFVLNMASQWLTFFMGNWVTAILIFGCIVILVIDLVAVNKEK